MGMRDWLIIIVIVGIILILIDGYRRKKSNSIRFKLDKNIPPEHETDDSEDLFELPNGGARVLRRGEAGYVDDLGYDDDDDHGQESEYDSADEYDEYEEYDDEEDESVEEPAIDQEEYNEFDEHPARQEDGPDDENVPVLMDAVEIQSSDAVRSNPEYEDGDEALSSQNSDDEFKEIDAWDDEDELEEEGLQKEGLKKAAAESDTQDTNSSPDSEDSFVSSRKAERIEPTFGDIGPLSDEELEDKPSSLGGKNKHKESDQASKKAPDKKAATHQAELFSDSPNEFPSDEDEEDYSEPEEVIVINVMAKSGEFFAGKDLLPILLSQGMQLGSMSIFHKHADNNGNGPVMFSMANMVKPGTFDVTEMESFSTPGISFFLQLPNTLGNMRCFEQMLTAANAIKESLNGELKDEHRSVITRQTIEHCRQRIQDFELAQLSRK